MKLFRVAAAFLLALMFSVNAGAHGRVIQYSEIIPAHEVTPGTSVYFARGSEAFSKVSTRFLIRKHDHTLRVAFTQSVPDDYPNVVVVDRLTTYWINSPLGAGKIRVTMPVRYYLASWDVEALERELERLGVKVKPKPAPPKPTTVITG